LSLLLLFAAVKQEEDEEDGPTNRLSRHGLLFGRRAGQHLAIR